MTASFWCIFRIATVFFCVTLAGLSSAFVKTKHNDQQKTAVELLISRLLPGREREFNVVIDANFLHDTDKHLDSFELLTIKDNILQITATSGVAAAWGLNHFLKYYCKAHISWSGRQLRLPPLLPKVVNATKIVSPNRYRYYQNVCTSSYSFVWWNWTRWEKEIDWMALNGINLPLAFTGQEEIWRRVYVTLRVSQDQLDKHFAGPAFLAWGRMGNLRGWGGPLPSPSWYETQLALQHKILARMRSFGMKPVLPGFAGHVPAAIQTLYPGSKIHRLGDWGRFNSTYCCTYFLDPSDSLFQKIGKLFIEEQLREYNGTEHIYNADSFNEMTPPSSDPKYLSAASHSVLSAMQAADPEAIWLMQGWLFRERSFWKPAQTKALLTGVPIGKMIVLDLFAEVDPIWKETESFYGQPFIWCMLHNFGGNLGLYGKVESVVNGPIEAHNSQGSTIQGTGIAPEGIEQNDFIYDLMAEMGWRRSNFDLVNWSKAYAERRYGSRNEYADKAWELLVKSVYNCSDSHADHNHGIPVCRPSLTMTYSVWYEYSNLVSAWKNLLSASQMLKHSTTFRYDLVDVGRQVLQDLSYQYYVELMQAYHSKNLKNFDAKGEKLLGLLNDLDILMSADKHFLLGIWLENARKVGDSPSEKSLYEFNARNQITIWGPDGNINDYANKMWGGLIKSYYATRWRLFIAEARAAMVAGKELDMKTFNEKLLEFERSWNLETNVYPVKETGSSVLVSFALYQKYEQEIGHLSVSGFASHNHIKHKPRSGYSFVEHTIS